MKSLKILQLVSLLVAVALVGGCAATYTGIRYGDLKVENKMSASINLRSAETPIPAASYGVFRSFSHRPVAYGPHLRQETMRSKLRGMIPALRNESNVRNNRL
jgi:hypothetical protein